ncbi:RNA recognition motif protein [Spraguea lophii 42_110]|uniref:Nuclear cap-binding protein subunit 2 n=1 Tax=Spraguea lophii (strain 42_110) TaxID=1358809 RepID=S7WDF9_SPRLO|nr:RNA recognition motif protein [Spraguea lophii 42_110]
MLLEDYYKSKQDYFYRDITYVGSESEYVDMIIHSSTLYVGDIAESVNESRLWEVFSTIKLHEDENNMNNNTDITEINKITNTISTPIKRIIMGKNKRDCSRVGFAFIEFYTPYYARRAQQLLNGMRLDNKYIKCDIDYGFVEGREYGRGYYGGQFKNDSKRQKKVQARGRRWL